MKSYTPGKTDEELRDPRMNWRKWRSARLPRVAFDFQWRLRLPVRAKAIAKTADTLFVAGPEDLIDEESVYGNTRSMLNRKLLEKQNKALLSPKGGKLMAVSVVNGGVVQKMDLESGPVWDGMAAAYAKLFICCKDGSVVALANDGTDQADGTYNPDALNQPKAALPSDQVKVWSPWPPATKSTAPTKPKSKAALTEIGGKIAGVGELDVVVPATR